MGKTSFISIALAALLATALYATWPRQPRPTPGEVAGPAPPAAQKPPVGSAGEAQAEPVPVTAQARRPSTAAASPQDSDLESRFGSSRDFTSLFEELMQRARAGEAEAAYFAYRIHQACSYREPDDTRTLQEALADFDQEFARYAVPGVGFAGDWRLQERRSGIERAWQACPPELLTVLADHDETKLLAQAAELGHPLAEATLASELLRNDRSGVHREEALAYLRRAAHSRDPEVLFEIGGAVALAGRSADDEDFRRANAWRLLACWHGLECGPENTFIQQTLCHRPGSPRCIPGAGLEHYMRSWDPGGFAETYALADQMMQAMSDGRWDDLQF